MLVLIVDIGSSSVRASIFDVEVLGAEHSPPFIIADVPVARSTNVGAAQGPDGSTNFDALAGRVDAAIDGCLAELPPNETRPIAAIGMDTFVMNWLGVDEHGAVVTPVFTYADKAPTTPAHVEALISIVNETLPGGAAELAERTGAPLHRSYAAPQLRRYRAEHPAEFARVAMWQSASSLIMARWQGKLWGAVSFSEASWTGLLEWRERMWHAGLVDLVDLGRDKLPPLLDLGGLGGADGDDGATLGATYGGRWARCASARIFLACGDGAAASIGSGAVHTGEIAISIGTSGAARIVLDAVTMAGLPHWRVPAGLWCYIIDETRLVLGGAVTDGGSLWEWSLATLCGNKASDDAAADARRSAVAAEANALSVNNAELRALTVLPFLRGERAPGWAPDATLAVKGATSTTRPAHILRATMDAAIFRLGLIVTSIDRHVLSTLATLEHTAAGSSNSRSGGLSGGSSSAGAASDERLGGDVSAAQPSAALENVHPDGLTHESGHTKRAVMANGGALEHSEPLCQVLSDVLQRPVIVRGSGETTSVGVVVLIAETFVAEALANPKRTAAATAAVGDGEEEEEEGGDHAGDLPPAVPISTATTLRRASTAVRRNTAQLTESSAGISKLRARRRSFLTRKPSFRFAEEVVAGEDGSGEFTTTRREYTPNPANESVYVAAIAQHESFYRTQYRGSLASNGGATSRVGSMFATAAGTVGAEAAKHAKAAAAAAGGAAKWTATATREAAATTFGRVAHATKKSVRTLKRAAGLNPTISGESNQALFDRAVTEVEKCFDEIENFLPSLLQGLIAQDSAATMRALVGELRTMKSDDGPCVPYILRMMTSSRTLYTSHSPFSLPHSPALLFPSYLSLFVALFSPLKHSTVGLLCVV